MRYYDTGVLLKLYLPEPRAAEAVAFVNARLMQALRSTKSGYLADMKTLETDIEIGADGSVRLLSPLPAWLKPGRAHVLLTVESEEEKPKLQKLTATPAMVAQREAALEKIRKLNPYGHITDPVAWQREIREDCPLPGRD